MLLKGSQRKLQQHLLSQAALDTPADQQELISISGEKTMVTTALYFAWLVQCFVPADLSADVLAHLLCTLAALAAFVHLFVLTSVQT
jgi:hypothetical protein